MSSMARVVQVFMSLMTILPLVLPASVPMSQLSLRGAVEAVSTRVDAATTSLFRTQVSIDSPVRRRRLMGLGVVILTEDTSTATVLADAPQLEALARLGFAPRDTDDLGLLASTTGGDGSPIWASLTPLLEEAAALPSTHSASAGADAGVTMILDAAWADLRAAMHALTQEQQALIAGSISPDDDADGLTNTQEQWWCTDPLNPDTDSDGISDGDEIQMLKDWIANRRAGPPGDTPWPSWPFNDTTCPDKDHDSIPNLAERWELGLNMDWESTDHDKFDDGQELFGVTYCPGGDLSCGYGDLPRGQDSGYVGATMPAWVKAPGNHPLVAAFPVPEVDVVESSFHMETVTTVTTDHTIGKGTERSYSTAKTDGTSTSHTQTTTWNDWEEFAETNPLSTQSIGALEAQDYFDVSQQILNYESTSLTLVKTDNYYLSKPSFGDKVSGLVSLVQAPGKVWRAGREIAQGINDAIFLTSYYGPPWKWNLEEYNEMKARDELARCKASGGLTCTERAWRVYLLEQGQQAADLQALDAEGQNFVAGVAGLRTTVDSDGAYSRPYYPLKLSVNINQLPTRTETRGRSWGGGESTTTGQYEQHTVTNGEQFSNSESWSTATAVDSSHAADLWFTYKVRNTGTEYAREVADLAFNIYIGNDSNPAYTYHVANDVGGDGKFHNFMPGEEHTYTSAHTPLSLEQMKAVDLGGPVRIVVEDYTYGVDEDYYEDAAQGGVTIAIEDGMDDGDEAIDTYIIPIWGGETVLDVLARYFPYETDGDGNLIAIWTPEYRSDTPAWCNEPRRVGTTLWCKHALSTADWWNIYTNGLGDGSEGFQDTPAVPGSVALFRFNKDSDLDGYSDRSERKLGTNPLDPASHPHPELIAGVHSIRTGDHVTATLSLLNTGLYDAYGVEAVMIAPDDSVSIINNTVGGSGRVRALKQVIVGSRILLQSPLPSAWTQTGHAVPAAGGYYTGQQDRTYTFTVSCGTAGGCEVGDGNWTLDWDDGDGHSGSLAFGAGYASPSALDVDAFGLKLGLLSGHVDNGDTFTIETRTPRDTFQYTINREPYTAPLVIVSYNDPQGNHRFVIPSDATELAHPTDDLTAHSGEMLSDVGVEIVTTGNFAPSENTTNLVVDNPTETTLTDAHLFLEFVNISGTVASDVPVTVTLPPGPTVVPVAWSTNVFSPTFQSNEDYIVMAFWTDREGNIIDTAARPLSSFQADPKPALAMADADATWDFGTVSQGTVVKRTFTFANTGFLDLLTYVSAPPGITLSQQGSRRVGPAGVTAYEITLNTADLSTAPYDGTITIRTSDPDNPVRTVHVVGNIIADTPDTPPGSVVRPLDWPAVIAGDHTQGEWVTFQHILGPDPQTLHPVKVYSADYATLFGVGKYATDFSAGTAPADMFGDGRDGDLVVGAGQTVYVDRVRTSLTYPIASPAKLYAMRRTSLNADRSPPLL